MQAKTNLNIIVELDQKNKGKISLFDRLWYTKRQQLNSNVNGQIAERDGIVFDGEGFMANSSSMKKEINEKNVEELIMLPLLKNNTQN